MVLETSRVLNSSGWVYPRELKENDLIWTYSNGKALNARISKIELNKIQSYEVLSNRATGYLIKLCSDSVLTSAKDNLNLSACTTLQIAKDAMAYRSIYTPARIEALDDNVFKRHMNEKHITDFVKAKMLVKSMTQLLTEDSKNVLKIWSEYNNGLNCIDDATATDLQATAVRAGYLSRIERADNKFTVVLYDQTKTQKLDNFETVTMDIFSYAYTFYDEDTGKPVNPIVRDCLGNVFIV